MLGVWNCYHTCIQKRWSGRNENMLRVSSVVELLLLFGDTNII